MGYVVQFKSASLKQIFSLASKDYSRDCVKQLDNVLRKESPDNVVIGILGRPRAIITLKSTPDDALKEKILALPFVKGIETLQETAKRNKSLKGKVAGLVHGLIY